MKGPEVKKSEEVVFTKRWSKAYKIAGIIFIVMGILILLWSIVLTLLTGFTMLTDVNDTLIFLMGVIMTGIGFWYYFLESKPIVTGIVYIILGILTLLWSIISTIAGINNWLFYITGTFMLGYGFWHYFWKCKRIKRVTKG